MYWMWNKTQGNVLHPRMKPPEFLIQPMFFFSPNSARSSVYGCFSADFGQFLIQWMKIQKLHQCCKMKEEKNPKGGENFVSPSRTKTCTLLISIFRIFFTILRQFFQRPTSSIPPAFLLTWRHSFLLFFFWKEKGLGINQTLVYRFIGL